MVIQGLDEKECGGGCCLNAPRRLKQRTAMMGKSINLGLEVNWLIFQHDFIC